MRANVLLLGAAMGLCAAMPVIAADNAAAPAVAKPPAIWQEPITGMEFVRIPKGCFQMGNRKPVSFREEARGLPTSGVTLPFDDELPQHEVCVDGFWLGKYEVSNADWQRIMGSASHGSASKSALAPATGMTWKQAADYAAKLTEQSGGKYRFRLPTEAEWEYACRAGNREETIPTNDELQANAWYAILPDRKQTEPQPVGQLAANSFGLYDMLGNAWEWVQDSYDPNAYAKHGLFNPMHRSSTANRVIRGASYRSQPIHVRCAKRSHYDATQSLGTIGLRLVRTP